jgi:hypothetical protein
MPVELARSGGEPRIDPGQRAPVRLVATVLRCVGRALRECRQLGRNAHDAQRLRQLASELVHLAHVEVERGRGLPHQRMPRDLVRHIGVAVAISADPTTQPQEGGHFDVRVAPVRAQQVFDLGVQLRQLAQKRVAVVGQAVLDLIVHGEPQLAQDARLPQSENHTPQRFFVGGSLLVRHFDAVALGQQPGDGEVAVENALALNFGRMRSENRGDQRLGEESGDLLGTQAGVAHARERQRQAAVLRRGAAELVHPPPAFDMQILGDVGELREVGERPDDGHGGGRRKHIQRLLELRARPIVAIAPEANRRLANSLDELERRFPFLLA